MAKRSVKVSGLRELERALSELPKSTAKNVVKRTLRKSAEPLINAWQGNVPVKTGQYRDNIKIGTRKDIGKIAYGKTMKLTGGDKAAAREAMKEARRQNPKSFSQILVGVHSKVRQAIPLEFGTEKMPAQPSARPAFDATQDEVLEIISSELGGEIQKAAQRLAKKARK